MFKQIAKDKKFWNKVKTCESYKPMVQRLFELYNEYCIQNDIPSTKFTEYKLYFETGDRYIYEKPYFFKRKRMNTLALLCLIYPENNEYLEKLQDTIWAICDEYSWVLPAHVKNYPLTEYTTIDLFSAETGFALSEIKFLLEDRLSYIIKSRIDDEINKRILSVFKSCTQSWEKSANNWAAVCAASVAASFMYQSPDDFETVKPRINSAMDAFLSGYPDDGACLEGLSYWEYGFGFYIWYAELLNDFTNGSENLFKNEKLLNISDFAQKTYLTPNITTSFSDGTPEIKINVGISHFLKSVYGEKVSLIPHISTKTDDHCGRWCHHVRAFVFFNPQYINSELKNSAEYYFNNAQWYIKRTPSYSFAVKGGNNNEPHNHNDIGSFIIAKGDRQILADLGCGEYTKEYFRPETRYEILCNSSFGHSVPVINGKAQCAGEEYHGNLTVHDNIVTINMKNAYNEPTLKKLERKIETTKTSIKLTDSFEFEGDGSYLCRLVSYTNPEFYDNNVVIGFAWIEYDDTSWEVCVTEKTHTDHISGSKLKVYLIDFKPLKKQQSIELNIKILEQLKMINPLNNIPPFEIADGFEIRMYEKGDENAWTQICKHGLLEANEGVECWEKYMLCFETLIPQKDTFFVYDKNNNAVATSTCFVEEEGIGNFHMVAAKPEARGNKLGWAMTTFALNKIAKELEQKNAMVRLKSDDWRLPAVRSYLKAGYRPVLYGEGMVERWQKICNKLNLHQIEMLNEDGTPTGIVL